MAVKTETEVTK